MTNALESHLYRYEMQQASGIVTNMSPSNIYKYKKGNIDPKIKEKTKLVIKIFIQLSFPLLPH